jgi:hypothetical protein
MALVFATQTLSEGYDPTYVWRQVDRDPAKDAPGCYIGVGESGCELPGRWLGPGATAIRALSSRSDQLDQTGDSRGGSL